MIDLHCHLLPGIDDGPADMEASLEMAEVALREGITTIVATPHVDLRYGVGPNEIEEHLGALKAALSEAGLALDVTSGAELALTRCAGFDDDQLRSLCLGGSRYALVESPYSHAGPLIEDVLFDLQVRGFRPLLAHPERCPEFQRDPVRLGRLVARGVACSVSFGSLVGQFGRTVSRTANELLDEGLVHNISSDAHDAIHRPPSFGLLSGRHPESLGWSGTLRRWLIDEVPAAILADEPLPPPPASRRGRPSLWSRIAARG